MKLCRHFFSYTLSNVFYIKIFYLFLRVYKPSNFCMSSDPVNPLYSFFPSIFYEVWHNITYMVVHLETSYFDSFMNFPWNSEVSEYNLSLQILGIRFEGEIFLIFFSPVYLSFIHLPFLVISILPFSHPMLSLLWCFKPRDISNCVNYFGIVITSCLLFCV